MKLFKSVILSALSYGSETWAPIAAHVKHLQGFIIWCVRIILGVTRWEQKRNTAAEDVNEEMEAKKTSKKDELKQRREICSQGQTQTV